MPHNILFFLLSLLLRLILSINLPLTQNLTSSRGSPGAGPSSSSGGGGTHPDRDPSTEPTALCVQPSDHPEWGVRSQSDTPLQWDDCKQAWATLQMRLFPQNRQREFFWIFWRQGPPPKARHSMRTPVDAIHGNLPNDHLMSSLACESLFPICITILTPDACP